MHMFPRRRGGVPGGNNFGVNGGTVFCSPDTYDGQFGAQGGQNFNVFGPTARNSSNDAPVLYCHVAHLSTLSLSCIRGRMESFMLQLTKYDKRVKAKYHKQRQQSKLNISTTGDQSDPDIAMAPTQTSANSNNNSSSSSSTFSAASVGSSVPSVSSFPSVASVSSAPSVPSAAFPHPSDPFPHPSDVSADASKVAVDPMAPMASYLNANPAIGANMLNIANNANNASNTEEMKIDSKDASAGPQGSPSAGAAAAAAAAAGNPVDVGYNMGALVTWLENEYNKRSHVKLAKPVLMTPLQIASCQYVASTTLKNVYLKMISMLVYYGGDIHHASFLHVQPSEAETEARNELLEAINGEESTRRSASKLLQKYDNIDWSKRGIDRNDQEQRLRIVRGKERLEAKVTETTNNLKRMREDLKRINARFSPQMVNNSAYVNALKLRRSCNDNAIIEAIVEGANMLKDLIYNSVDDEDFEESLAQIVVEYMIGLPLNLWEV